MAFGYYPTAWSLAIECELRAADRIVLLAIVDYANHEGVCWPSQATLASVTGLASRTIRSALARLEDKGLIRRHPRHLDNGGRTSDLISVLFAPLAGDAGGSSDRPSATHAIRQGLPGGAAPVAYEPRIEVPARKERRNGRNYQPVGPCVSGKRTALARRLETSEPYETHGLEEVADFEPSETDLVLDYWRPEEAAT